MRRFDIRLFCGFCNWDWDVFGVGCGDLMRGMRGFDALLRLTHPTLDLGLDLGLDLDLGWGLG